MEKGKPLNKRICPSAKKTISCLKCTPCNVTTGWGGAGAYSDGKLNLGKFMAGWLPKYINQETYEHYLTKVDNIWLQYGAPKKLYGVNGQVDKLEKKITKAGFTTLIGPTRHLGTERNLAVLQRLYDYLSKKIKIIFNSDVAEITTKAKKAYGIKLMSGKKYKSSYIIVAPGREGCSWFFKESKRLGLTMYHHPVQLGVRVETKASVMKHLTDYLYEAKLFFKTPTFGDEVRTFCMCPKGEVVQEQFGGFKGVVSVNGHSFGERKTKNTNFALLVSTDFDEPFKEPIIYGENITRLANLLSSGVIVQRLGDLLVGRRSNAYRISRSRIKPTLKTATPGDLSFVLPYRHMINILEMIKQMDKLAPGIFNFDTLLYGVEVKFYSSAPKLSSTMESEVKNLFAVGDGAGVTRNLTHACISGMVAGKEVAKRIR